VGGNGNGATHGQRAVLPMETAETALYDLVNEAGDDRDDIQPGDHVVLIVENDEAFARFLLEAARNKGMKGLVTSLGATALALVRQYQPHAVTLDLHLPDIDGWRVLERLKCDVALRHIPICVISTDESRERALKSGALAFLAKPIPSHDLVDRLLDRIGAFAARTSRKLLLFEPDAERRKQLLDCLEGKNVEIETADDVSGAMSLLREAPVDCIIAGVASPEFADALADFAETSPVEFGRLNVVACAEAELIEPAWNRLSHASTFSHVRSLDRMLDVTALYGHLSILRMAERQRQILLDLYQSDKPLAGRRVLIVDDDIRNIFALSTVLEEHEMDVISADNGRDAIERLRQDPDIDIVLMDIMMPEMDGMETMREIRKISSLKELPIVAVTAKAMKGDREKCIEAGAWDYLAKPVDGNQMLAVLRAWLHR
jgi:CheY-like chemotaxis protein